MSKTSPRFPIAAVAAPPAPSHREGTLFTNGLPVWLCRLLISSVLTAALAGGARADIDMALNTSNFVAGQASTLSVDGLVTTTGDSTSILGAGLTIRFDPSRVALSNLHADSSTTWSLMAYNTDHLAEGWAKAVLLNTADGGQTTDGPI